jgi:tetratricopeptide (TPR) repeat protein
LAFVDAEHLLLESVLLTGDFYGKRSAEFSACLANLANTIIRLPGRYSEAIDLLNQALNIAKECHGENSAEAARIYTNLGFSDSFSGRVSDASEMLKTAEDIVFENNLDDKEILAVNFSNMSKERYLAGKEAELALPYGKPDRIDSGLLQSLPGRSGLNLALASNQFCRTSRCHPQWSAFFRVFGAVKAT